MNINNPTHASALDLHDQLHAIMDRLEPVMIELASRPGIVGDGVAENEIVMQLDHAIEALWSYLQQPNRRHPVRIAPVPPGMERLDGDPHFPMDRFKRLLVRFAHAAFTDDDLNEYHNCIAVYMGDGEGSGTFEEVVYWNNGDGSRQEAIATGHDTAEATESEYPALRDTHQQTGDDDVQITPRLRHLLGLAQKLARQKREYDAAGVDGDRMFEPDLLGKAITNVTNRIAECIEHGDDRDDDAGDDHSQDNPPAEDISIDIELPEPQTAKA